MKRAFNISYLFTAAIILLYMIAQTQAAYSAGKEPERGTEEYMLLKENRKDLPSAAVFYPYTISDFDGDGNPEVAQAVGKTLKLLGPNQVSIADIPALASPISLLLTTDMQADGSNELVIGTSDSGAVYVYEYNEDGLRRISQSKHIWSPTSYIVPLTIDSEPKKELFTVTKDGVGYIYKLTSQGLFQLWRGSAVSDGLQEAVSGDITGDGIDELFILSLNGQSVMMRYQDSSLRTVWQTRKKEKIVHIASVNIDSDKNDEYLTLSADGTLTVYDWDGVTLSIKTEYGLPNTTGSVFYADDIDYDGNAELLLGGGNKQLQVCRFSNGSLLNLGKAPFSEDVVSVAATPTTGTVLIHASGKLSKVRLVKADYVKVVVNGEEFMPIAPPVLKDGRVYLSARDAAALYKMTLGWDSELKVTQIKTNGVTYGFRADSTAYYIGTRKAANHLEAAPIMIDGKLFLPVKVLKSLFGVQAVWSASTRTLTIN